MTGWLKVDADHWQPVFDASPIARDLAKQLCLYGSTGDRYGLMTESAALKCIREDKRAGRRALNELAELGWIALMAGHVYVPCCPKHMPTEEHIGDRARASEYESQRRACSAGTCGRQTTRHAVKDCPGVADLKRAQDVAREVARGATREVAREVARRVHAMQAENVVTCGNPNWCAGLSYSYSYSFSYSTRRESTENESSRGAATAAGPLALPGAVAAEKPEDKPAAPVKSKLKFTIVDGTTQS